MERAITGYHLDDVGEWVAELSCGHNQHVRHRPPFQLRAWVLDADQRAAHRGTPLDCPLCDRAELPDGLRFVRSSRQWDERTLPPGLLKAHRISAGTWGLITVHSGRLQFIASTTPWLEVIVEANTNQAIPPEVEHEVKPLGPVCLSIDFFSVARQPVPTDEPEHSNLKQAPNEVDQGGEPPCLMHLFDDTTRDETCA